MIQEGFGLSLVAFDEIEAGEAGEVALGIDRGRAANQPAVVEDVLDKGVGQDA